ncbi:MAG: protoporphyrinogen IX oxidase [Flavobacteriales bacterium]|nr:MAG: protoporphyrinogen IX oxidase [Flavobacteriales bacterium]
MSYLTIKALHIIFIITWFAGLFYIVRLFIYYKEAEKQPEPARQILQKQYLLMSKRLWHIITWPSAILTLILATWLLWLQPAWLLEPWMWVKLICVALLYLYHFSCQHLMNKMKKGIMPYSSAKIRMWNEVATILLFAIVFLVVLKNTISWIFGVSGLIGLGILLMLGYKWYKKLREKP